MTSVRANEYGFAVTHDVPIPYLQRIREYYQALGYGAPYEWAHYAEAPFHALNAPLSECRVALITTAAPYQPGKGDQGPGAPYNSNAKFYAVYSADSAQNHDLRISHVAIDRQHTTAEDPAAYLEAAPGPRTTVQSPLKWSASPDWKLDYSNIERLTPDEIARRRAEFDKGKAEAKRVRENAGSD